MLLNYHSDEISGFSQRAGGSRPVRCQLDGEREDKNGTKDMFQSPMPAGKSEDQWTYVPTQASSPTSCSELLRWRNYLNSS